MITYLSAILVIGLNFCLWGTFGALRFSDENLGRLRARRSRRMVEMGRWAETGIERRHAFGRTERLTCDDVAVLIAAHNEELVIGASLVALSDLISMNNVHVMSDASSDRTVAIARAHGAHAAETKTNVGKASAIRAGIEHFRLLESFKAVMILDADTQLDPEYFAVALPLFDDSRVVAVAGCAQTRWQRKLGVVGSILVAHRQRVYVLTQLLLKYGQTWRGVSATHIIPGFASMYRTWGLREIDINPPGLVIEDFNMTFEIHAKKLGRIAFHPGARAYTQDPDRYLDYTRQTKRWALGLWQTIRRHRLRASFFNATLLLLLVELITSSVLYLLLVPVVLLIAIPDGVNPLLTLPWLGDLNTQLSAHISLQMILVGVLLPDYALTCVTAAVERRPRYLLLGLFFPLMKVTDAAIALYSLPRAWTERSTGRWVSPPRRADGAHSVGSTVVDAGAAIAGVVSRDGGSSSMQIPEVDGSGLLAPSADIHRTAGTTHAETDERDDPDHSASKRLRGFVEARDLVLAASLLVAIVLTAVLAYAASQGQRSPIPVAGNPGVAVPAPPAAAPNVGSYTESRVAANGDVRVRQWVRSPEPLSKVRLQMPAVSGVERLPEATNVVVASDQELLSRPRMVTSKGRRLLFSAPPRVVYLSYTLKGAVVISPSARGRALAQATGMHIAYHPRTGPSRVTVISDKVLSMACSDSSVATPRPCGVPGKHRWSILLHGDARNDTVVAQVDLTRTPHGSQ